MFIHEEETCTNRRLDGPTKLAIRNRTMSETINRRSIYLLNEENFKKEYNHILNIANLNGFGKEIIINKLKKFRQQKRLKENTSLQSDSKKGKQFKKITYHPEIHNKYQKIFKKFNITLALINKFSLGNLLNMEGSPEWVLFFAIF
ncbi:hypothetical protein L9F63_018797 [Diploptera punctata]|uniref:Uncharacterized protein n=1 Tax=Diploptera punctata TaxID=6984 RepID=A0AAD8EF37_DIPPU|nr:hypothetical protein L9F63_018797 [Diploptera punctata]